MDYLSYLKLNSLIPFLQVDYKTAMFIIVAVIILLVFILIFYRTTTIKNITERNKVLGLLLNSVPVSVVRCLNDNNLTIKYFNKSYLRLFGDEPIKQLVNIIDKEDLFVAKRSLRTQLENKSEFEIKFRAQKIDGSTIWLLCRGNKYTDNMVEHLYCVLLDITKSVEMERQQKIDQEKYRIVAEASDSVIFEFNLREKTIYCTNKFQSKFGFAPYQNHVPRAIYYFKFVHPDDLFKLKSMYNSFYNGSVGSTEELRLKKFDNTYIWCEVRFSAIFDERGLPIRAVGKIIDIDKIKKERENLLKANELDAFTGLLNKNNTFKYINEVLKDYPYEKHALLFIDIDHFKQINDKYGHLQGDKVLLKLAKCIKSYCEKGDISGRIGGDEFLVLLKDYTSLDGIEVITKALCCDISSIDVNDKKNVTVSIGISLYPQDSKDSTELYIKADQALYLAKAAGRNTYKFINNDIQEIENSTEKN